MRIFNFYLFFGCKKDTPPLTAASQLEGSWTTSNPVKFYYRSDGCGEYTRYSSFSMKVNWQITALVDSAVSITETMVSSGVQTFIGSNCGLPPPPLLFRWNVVKRLSHLLAAKGNEDFRFVK